MLGLQMKTVQMATQGYKRTNFDEDDCTSNGDISTPDLTSCPPVVGYRGNIYHGFGLWKSRSLLEKLLMAILLLLLLLVLILAIVVAVKSTQLKNAKKEANKLCLTSECVSVASTLMSFMQTSVNPCDDFYTYACGGWEKANPIPSGHARWGTFDILWQRNMLVMKNAIDRPDMNFTSQAERKAKWFFQSCMDEDKLIEQAGGRPLLELLQQQDWGINLTSWTPGFSLPSNWDFNTMLEASQRLGMTAFFDVGVAEDDKNSSSNILQVDQGGLGLPDRDFYVNKTIDNDKILSAYLKYMVKVFTLLGAPNETHTTGMMANVIELESQIANITTPEDERRDDMKMYHKFTLEKMQVDFTQIRWVPMINGLLNSVGLTVGLQEDVVVYAPEYLTQLEGILREYKLTDEGNIVLHQYFLWRLVSNFVSLLSKPFREAQREFSESISGVQGNDEAWHTCITSTDAVLGFATGSLFVKKTFQGASKQKAKTMINNVRDAFKANLPKLSWMDPKTQEAAIDKANAVRDMIGYPDYIKDKDKLDKKYQGLSINASDYFGNNVASLQFSIKKSLEKLRKSPKNEWMMTPPRVNAYYTASKNTIVFPAGILQAPFFDRSFPQSLNYGAMGVVMGHELTHGFDDQGREFDKKGNLKQWWDLAAVKRFKNKTECMVNQYSSYKLNNENERGKQTLGENIADNGGLKSAYSAYQKWVSQNGEEKELPAIGLSHKQLFFLSFAQVWCWNSKPESDHLQVIKDQHSPAKTRVIGPLSNSKDFAKVFNCPLNSRMNPEKKCEVW